MSKYFKCVSRSLDKLKAQPWASPLGTALSVTGGTLEVVGNFVPGVGILGGALAAGSTLLKPSNEDLQKDIRAMHETLKNSQNESVRKILEDNIANLEKQQSEIREDFAVIKEELGEVMSEIQTKSHNITEEISSIKDIINLTFGLVTDIRYKVSRVNSSRFFFDHLNISGRN